MVVGGVISRTGWMVIVGVGREREREREREGLVWWCWVGGGGGGGLILGKGEKIEQRDIKGREVVEIDIYKGSSARWMGLGSRPREVGLRMGWGRLGWGGASGLGNGWPE
ncbi:unnamed protein product [Prunus armeniaca]|uniref:Uncharacterized protein n=1 Tax=Prunus armeniaca TaxID=36596 RepID=A0A6J5XZ23_PRUAR|nr:unnamed protein product [Prunus armeniaca]